MDFSNRAIDASNAIKSEQTTTHTREPLGLRRDTIRVLRVKSGLKTGSIPTEKP